jgi:hypothetical protein
MAMSDGAFQKSSSKTPMALEALEALMVYITTLFYTASTGNGYLTDQFQCVG